ncbi:MAG: hypothetical protein KBE04_05820 [Phycisphaerae bacterium]|nr:hypothetical protein [Phycisphaerae bacterium]
MDIQQRVCRGLRHWGWSLVIGVVGFSVCRAQTTSEPVPFPGDGATEVPVNVALRWAPVAGATSYDVYFGTYAGPPKVATTTVSSYDPGVLAFGQRYYWEIVARNACGDTSGPMWEFTTRAASSKVVLPLVRRP